jgi:TP53 regulating kinase-like protein
MILGQGAEAILRRQGDAVVKDRVAKEYRLPEIDNALRRSRTRREARILDKLQKLNFPAPRVSSVDEEKMHVIMGYIDGPQVKEVLHDNPAVLSREIGRKVGILHANDIIHGDLTTSNMILSNGEVHFIDFGLSNVSTKAEDKAVDLHLLDRALESKHHELYAQCIAAALEGYKETNPNASEIFARLEKVEQRGRNKKK